MECSRRDTFRSLVPLTDKPAEKFREIGIQYLLALSHTPRQSKDVPGIHGARPSESVIEPMRQSSAYLTAIAKCDRADTLADLLTVESCNASLVKPADDGVEA